MEWRKAPQVSERLPVQPELEQERSPRLQAPEQEQAQVSPASARLLRVQAQREQSPVQLVQQALSQELVLLEPRLAPSLPAGMGPGLGPEWHPLQPAEPARKPERPVWRLWAWLEEEAALLPAHRRAGPSAILD
jgi:hypothetical protein